MTRLEASEQWQVKLEQVKLCTKIGIECMDLDPKKRPVARHIIDRLDKMASTIETGISGSSKQQHVSFIKEQYHQEKIAKCSSEYLGKDIKERVEAQEVMEYVGIPIEYHSKLRQRKAPSAPHSYRKGLWSPEEDKRLREYIREHGIDRWNVLPAKAGQLLIHHLLSAYSSGCYFSLHDQPMSTY